MGQGLRQLFAGHLECRQCMRIARTGQGGDFECFHGQAGGFEIAERNAAGRRIAFHATLITATAQAPARLDDDVPDFHGNAMLAGKGSAAMDKPAADTGAKTEINQIRNVQPGQCIFTVSGGQRIVFDDDRHAEAFTQRCNQIDIAQTGKIGRL